jgi:hypothetical protein
MIGKSGRPMFDGFEVEGRSFIAMGIVAAIQAGQQVWCNGSTQAGSLKFRCREPEREQTCRFTVAFD